MHRQNAFNAFEFDNEAFFADVVDSEGSREFDTVVDDGQVNLVFEAEISTRQLVGKAGMVGAFEELQRRAPYGPSALLQRPDYRLGLASLKATPLCPSCPLC
jgi:hypothetical protein